MSQMKCAMHAKNKAIKVSCLYGRLLFVFSATGFDAKQVRGYSKYMENNPLILCGISTKE